MFFMKEQVLASILGSIVTLLVTALSMFAAYLFYKKDKRKDRSLKKIANYAKHIKAYYFLEKTYIERIKQYEPTKSEQTIMKECRNKMKDDYQIEIGTLLSANDVENDIYK